MKRILGSILLLLVALLLSKSFSAELENFTSPAQAVSGYALGENDGVEQSQAGAQSLSLAQCPCDTPPGNPTFTLVLIAVVMASFTMAAFIYGSQFIMNFVTG
jgi:hypothetical protein